MIRLIISVLVIAVSIIGFLTLTNPMLGEIKTLRAEVAAYDQALGNSKALENERDKLTKKYNSILPEDLVKVEKLLPDNVDNIRLILEIEKLAVPYGMVLKDVKYDTLKKEDEPTEDNTGAVGSDSLTESRKDYGVWSLEFSTSSNYNNFLNFIKALESNLRIVDISSIQFASNLNEGINPNPTEIYKYTFKINTYWLKN